MLFQIISFHFLRTFFKYSDFPVWCRQPSLMPKQTAHRCVKTPVDSYVNGTFTVRQPGWNTTMNFFYSVIHKTGFAACA